MSTKLAKTTKSLDPAHVGQVLKWIVAGHAEADIVEAIAQQFPDASPKPLIVEAVRRLADAARPNPDVLRGWCLEAVRSIYAKAVEVGDLQVALAAVKQLRTFIVAEEDTCSTR